MGALARLDRVAYPVGPGDPAGTGDDQEQLGSDPVGSKQKMMPTTGNAIATTARITADAIRPAVGPDPGEAAQ
jgi:hypothetical protein